MNNILKLSANWKALKLPELLEKLHQIVKLQYKDEKKSAWSRKLYSCTLDPEIPSKHCRLGIQD